MSPKPIRAQAAALLVAVVLLGPSIGYASHDGVAPARAGDFSSVRIDNFARVNLSYYRGGEPDDDQYATLAGLGIKTIVDLRGPDVDVQDKLLVERAGMKYVPIPMTTHEPPTASMVQGFLRLVSDPANQPVYVHCVGGRHRTGLMTAVYRMEHDRWTAEQAFKEMKQYKFGADFLHSEFKEFVYGYRPHPALSTSAASVGGG